MKSEVFIDRQNNTLPKPLKEELGEALGGALAN
jgi:hypothetical protein